MFAVDQTESSLDKLDRLTLRYRRENVLRNQHYQDLCQRYQSRYQLFRPTTNYHYIYIHRQTSTEILTNLIDVASQTFSFIIDTQNEMEPFPWTERIVPSLIQIQFQSMDRIPLVLLIEVLYLKTNFTSRTRDYTKEQKIKQLCKQIFSPNNTIYAWGNPREKLSSFYPYQLFCENDLDHMHLYDLHDHFKHWYKLTFPYSLIHQGRSKDQPYTLQTAIFLVFDEWLNTRMQYALWNCGIDTNLKTYYRQFSFNNNNNNNNKNYYQFIRQEIEYRQQMQTYVLYNCLAIKKILSLMLKQCPLGAMRNTPSCQMIHYKRKKRPRTLV